jgi:hypothetical protein
LKHQLLERGFLLRCESCSYYAWYPADEAGQTFRCPSAMKRSSR